jgi:hypothetical protein
LRGSENDKGKKKVLYIAKGKKKSKKVVGF